MQLQIQHGNCSMVAQDKYDTLIITLIDAITGYATVKEVLQYPEVTPAEISRTVNLEATRISALKDALKAIVEPIAQGPELTIS